MIMRQRLPKLLTGFRFCFHRPLCTSTASHNVHNANVVTKKDNKYVNYRKFPEHEVRINTCGKIYEEWKNSHKFFKVPDGDLTFDVRYIDTLNAGDDQSPINEDSAIVLALHGAPGSYDDYGLLTSFLYERGVRVIAPCFPDFSTYPPGVFRHSATEKAQYVQDFLKAINVPGIDMLVCHSSAAYPGLKLCFENKMPKISSLVLFNPGSYSTRMRATSPFPVIKAWVQLCETDTGLKLYQKYGHSLLKRMNLVVRVDNIMHPLLSATSMVYADIPGSRQLLHDLSILRFPVFLAFSEDDKMIDKELSYRVAYKLGLFDPQIGLVNKDGEIVKEGSAVKNIEAIAFENGSHYVFWKYPDIIHERIYSFMKKHIL